MFVESITRSERCSHTLNYGLGVVRRFERRMVKRQPRWQVIEYDDECLMEICSAISLTINERNIGSWKYTSALTEL